MRASRGEILIEEILQEAGFVFKEEYVFPDLKSTSGRPLRFDFVVFDDDLTERFQDIDEYNIKDHFILVDRQVGLTDLDCQKATDILCKDFSAC